MPESFVITNRYANTPAKLLLSSPAHGLASRKLVVLAYTGRRSGRAIDLIASYRENEDGITVGVLWPEYKTWWRNFTGEGGPIRVLLRGHWREGHAVATHEPGAESALVRITLDPAA